MPKDGQELLENDRTNGRICLHPGDVVEEAPRAATHVGPFVEFVEEFQRTAAAQLEQFGQGVAADGLRLDLALVAVHGWGGLQNGGEKGASHPNGLVALERESLGFSLLEN